MILLNISLPHLLIRGHMPGPTSGASRLGIAAQSGKAVGPRRLLELGVFAAQCKSLGLGGLRGLRKALGRGCGSGSGKGAACSRGSWPEQRAGYSPSALPSHLPRGPTLLQSRQKRRERNIKK